MTTPLRSELTKLASEVPSLRGLLLPVIKSARRSQEMIRLKYVNLGDFGGTDPVVDSWLLEVKGPYEAMQALLPTLKKYKFRFDRASKAWSIHAVNYAYSNRKRQNFWAAARRNQEAAYPLLKKMVEQYNAEAAKANRDMDPNRPTDAKGVMRLIQQNERLTNRLGDYGIRVEYDWPNRYSVDEATVWVFGDTFPVKDVMKRHGFRWGSGRKGRGWWIAAAEYALIGKAWAGDVFKNLPDITPAADTGGSPFSDMSRSDLLRWIKQHDVVEDDLRANEWYDGEVTDQEVLRQYLRDMPKWDAARQREVFNRGSLFPANFRYGASKTAVHPSWVARTLMKAEADLTRRAQNYTGDRDYTRARVEVNPKGWPIIHVWLQMQGDEGRPEAQELADILLGQGATVSQHKLIANLWIAEAVYQPR